ncbi:alpha-hydroxy acid oxidase [Ottowia thiooxydans]|uniref:(S)-mandelate dehydrogenase n=1 Tax=Ottowia thiooxydans TaxID=219182 RepID=A0ABV2QA35_9BURK
MHAVQSAWSIKELQRACVRRLPRPVLDFFEGGAEDEETLCANRRAFEQVRLVPRAFVDVSNIRIGANLIGAAATMPVAIAPMGAIAYGWPDGDIALAKAAAAAGVPYTLSTMASVSIERMAREVGGRLWFQAHLLQPRERTLQLVERARRAGYEALMITADLPRGGKRERDLHNALTIPFRMRVRHLPQFAARPGWCLQMLRHGTPRLPEALQASAVSQAGSSIGAGFDPSFDWDALRTLREAWPGKLIVKGILCGEDAQTAIGIGVDAIVVSNHGGRQLDGCIATMDALPEIAQVASGRVTVFLDGGVRRGRDVLKALCRGADAVLLGRDVLYGVCASGQAGAAKSLQIIRDELVGAMQLSGKSDISALCMFPRDPSLLWRDASASDF